MAWRNRAIKRKHGTPTAMSLFRPQQQLTPTLTLPEMTWLHCEKLHARGCSSWTAYGAGNWETTGKVPLVFQAGAGDTDRNRPQKDGKAGGVARVELRPESP